ncbi:MAG: 23S rRNA (adenine(2503)-C(2))-methyltransferase RlmN [Bacilli bacterium]|nr:23S rRNA (adenine(2503)-C(2))-methyltransferase RlmN [Bacilli bacterium]MBN2877777.1 23S rRNA (adenine(2503)-C(2))-methyltransferase RlmN [Bacilli bacterium]
MRNFYDVTITELQDILVRSGQKAYNADQIFKWVYELKVFDFGQMTNISKALREQLAEMFIIKELEIHTVQESSDGTVKYLFKLDDESLIETVLMRNDYGTSVCVTSQVGCNMGCSFCASGLIKKARDLSVYELVSQITSVEQHLSIRITNVVVMGTGEPFDNYDNVMDFIRIINYKQGLQIGSRHITVSTCGIVPKIYQYAKETIKTNLAISLHAANNELRNQLMPINKAYPIEAVLDACKTYFDMTGRRITFEYILLKGVNDNLDQADELSDLIRGINCYVNLIPYNPVLEFKYQKTDISRANEFHQRLLKRGINAILRREQGSDIDAACGQLRYKKENAI